VKLVTVVTKATKAQRAALILGFGKCRLLETEPHGYAFEDDVCTPYIGKQLEKLGMVRRHRLSHFPYQIQLQLMTPGRDALNTHCMNGLQCVPGSCVCLCGACSTARPRHPPKKSERD
jgi:hypothetical protein